MSAFTKNNFGWCDYYTVIQPEPHFPYGRGAYGVAGPFADEAEAKQAMEIIATQRPGIISIMRCSFDADYSAENFANMDSLQESARRSIAELRA